MSASMDLGDSVRALVLETLKTTCDANREIAPHTDLGDIGFDSLALSAVVASAEAHYCVEFSTDHILDMFQATLISDLAQAIAAAIVERRASPPGNV